MGSPEARALIADEIDRLSSDFKGYEKVRNFHIGQEDFTTENGMLTPTLKLKRRIVQKRYGDAIDSLYTEETADRPEKEAPRSDNRTPLA